MEFTSSEIKRVAVLGSTGSIGTQALEVCAENGFRVTALAANKNIELLAKQAARFKPNLVCVYDTTLYSELCKLIKDKDITVLCGMDGLLKAATEDDCTIVLNAVVGMIGLQPTLAAIAAGKDIALANKETIVTGGELVIKAARDKGVSIYPVDSEHSAIFSCMQGVDTSAVKRIILTASGGPFFGMTKDMLANKTKADALKHPNWDMGAKITIDSATLMNKGLEFIEAAFLFGLSADDIEVVVHRQSIVHSAVEFADYSVIAQLGEPDMKIPIQYALTYPNRVNCVTKRLSITDYPSLTFEKPDYDTFTCLAVCIKALKAKGFKPTIVNGANEEAVRLFLEDSITFLEIGALVERAFNEVSFDGELTVENILLADEKAREFVKQNLPR